MTDLTEQWKKGELPCGWYYIKIADIVFIDFFEGKVWKNKKNKYIDEVLAPIPSYKEWQEYKNANDSMFDTIKMLNKDNGKLEKENTKLKKLLKECYTAMGETQYWDMCKLLPKIDEAIK